MTMPKQMIALLHWLDEDSGGRSALPTGPFYTTVVRFEEQRDTWLEDAWSLVVEFIEEPEANIGQKVKIRFLVDDGPEKLLAVDKKFELMEGAKVVAKGRVLSSA